MAGALGAVHQPLYPGAAFASLDAANLAVPASYFKSAAPVYIVTRSFDLNRLSASDFGDSEPEQH